VEKEGHTDFCWWRADWRQNVPPNQRFETMLQNIEAMVLNFIVWKRIRIIIRFMEPVNQLYKEKVLTGEGDQSYFAVLSVAEGRDQLERRWGE
jgi:hypothetical protein